MPSHPIGPLYILHFSSTHHDFRLADLQASCDYLRIPFQLIPTPSSQDVGQDVSRPYMLAHLPSDAAAAWLLARCISLRSIWAYWSHGSCYSELHQRNLRNRALWEQHDQAPSWKAHIFSYSGTIPDARKLDVIQSFEYMRFKGQIRLRDPEMRWGVMEEYTVQERWPLQLLSTPTTTGDGDPRLVQIFCGRRIDLRIAPSIGPPIGERKSSDPALEGQSGLARDLIDKLSLKKRAYIGNTSMEAEMSLLQANMALCGPGKLVYDPFAGTGSLLMAAAAMGAMVLGSDIDGRAMRGKANKKDKSQTVGIVKSAQQYGLQSHLLDLAVLDVANAPWRIPGMVDAIVADPPYGVREGARRLGKRDPAKHRDEPFWLPDGLAPGQGCWSHERDDYIPPTRPYHLADLIGDLLEYAYRLLTPGGRLVFWLPDMIDDESQPHAGVQIPIRLPVHNRPAGTGRMRLVDHSLQHFGRWGRRLITMQKVPPHLDTAPPTEQQEEERRRMQDGVFRASADPAEFRNKYFVGRTERYT